MRQMACVRRCGLRLLFCMGVVTALYAQAPSSGSSIPSHPRELKYPKLAYNPPKAATYRRVLANGVVAFLAEDHDFPLVNVSVLVRTGSYLDPKGKEGLGAMLGSQLRAGGTTSLPPDKFDE